MRVTVEQIDRQCEEELIVRCYDPSAEWVLGVAEAASGHRTICGWQEEWMTDPFSTRRRRYSRRKRSCMSLNGCARAVPCFAAASP